MASLTSVLQRLGELLAIDPIALPINPEMIPLRDGPLITGAVESLLICSGIAVASMILLAIRGSFYGFLSSLRGLLGLLGSYSLLHSLALPIMVSISDGPSPVLPMLFFSPLSTIFT